MHVQRENESKLDNEVEKNIFIDHKDGIKCQKIWNPLIEKIIYNQDIVFSGIKSIANRNPNQGNKNEKQ